MNIIVGLCCGILWGFFMDDTFSRFSFKIRTCFQMCIFIFSARCMILAALWSVNRVDLTHTSSENPEQIINSVAR